MQGKAKELTKKIGIFILTLAMILLCTTMVFLAVPGLQEDKYNKQSAEEIARNNEEILTENANFYSRNYWEWHTRTTTGDTAYNGEHIQINGKTFRFFGYDKISYKDFLYKEYDKAGSKTFRIYPK